MRDVGEKEAELAALAGDHAEKVKEKDILSKTVEQLQLELDVALKKAAEQVTLYFNTRIHPFQSSSLFFFVPPSFPLYLSICTYLSICLYEWFSKHLSQSIKLFSLFIYSYMSFSNSVPLSYRSLQIFSFFYISIFYGITNLHLSTSLSSFISLSLCTLTHIYLSI